jgi:hypothetical protein
VGEATFQLPTVPPVSLGDFLPGQVDPLENIYVHARSGEGLFPVAMYRFQVPNDEFPMVSGDVVQVVRRARHA